MPDNGTPDSAMNNPHPYSLRFLRSQSADFSFMAHNPRNPFNSLTNVIRDFEPLVETARTVNAGVQNALSSSFLNRSNPQTVDNNTPSTSTNDQNNSFVINFDPVPRSEVVDQDIHTHAANFLNNVGNISNNNPDEANNPDMPTHVEIPEYVKTVLKYVPFLLILWAKALYDYYHNIFIILLLFITFFHGNSTIKKETTKRHRRSLSTLFIELLYIAACIIFIFFVYGQEMQNFNLVLNLVLIRTFTSTLTVWNLLWIVTITDFILKILTVTVKVLLTMLPGKIIDFKKRGKIYLFIEAVSQMYRSITTIQPWLYYLLESYQGPEKIVAVFLSAFYMISKGNDLKGKICFLKTASLKLLQNVTIGSSPSKDQIQSAGEHCPICHDEYESPVLLECRHIFCESCVTTWFDREQTCPLCRAKIVDDPSWRDGSTSHFIQLY